MDEQLVVLLFGPLTDVCGTTRLFIPLEKDTDTLLQVLKIAYPALDHMTFSMAVNQQVINGNTHLQIGNEIALLPPFSGG